MRRLCRHLLSTYFSADPRTLGLFRILFGAALLVDLGRRYLGMDYWYTDDGLMPGASMSYMHSLFLLAGTRGQVLIGMSICLVAFAALAAGFMTRTSQLLSFVCVTSLNNRVGVLENGGNIALNLLAAWTLFLPLGRRFSVDALLRARRSGAAPGAPRPCQQPVVSFAVLALLLQLATIYLFNFLNKSGPTWRNGSAVYYALHQDRFTTPLAVWMRETLPHAVLSGLTAGTLFVEASAVVLILSPVWTSLTRLTAMAVLLLLHLGFALCLDLGSFSYAMICFLSLLLTREHWTGLDLLLGREPGRLERAEVQPQARRRSAQVLLVVREALVVLLLVAAFGAVQRNPAWPQSLKYEQPRLLKWIIQYPRLFQEWIMFSPDAPRRETMLVVEAVTADGRTVDPYSDVASRALARPVDPVAFRERFFREGIPRLGQDQFFADYSERIAQRGWEVFHPALGRWILRYPERTGDPADAIVRYEVCNLTMLTAGPGQPPQQGTRSCFLRYP